MNVPTKPAATRFFDPDSLAEPFEVWSELREQAPVCPVSRNSLEGVEFTVVSRYRDVMAALRDPDGFSNQLSRRFVGGHSPYEDTEEVKAILANACPYVDALAFADGELHTRHRRMVLRGFSARRIRQLEGVIATLSAELVDSLPLDTELDFWHEVCNPLPISVMAEILGVHPDDAPRMKTWADAQVARLNGQASEDEQEALEIARTMVDFHRYIIGQIELRRRVPHDDFLGDLVANSAGMSLVELVHVCSHLLIGGAETTASLIGSLLDHLVDHPAKLAALRADRSRIPEVVEEVLRMQAPIKLVYRVTTRDVELGGEAIPANTVVLLMLGSANRDPDAFPEPERFEEYRAGGTHHIAFGYGPHLCPGATLARAEARIFLETVFDRPLELCRERNIERKHRPNLTFREFSEVPLVLHRSR
jgi:cytochrome P450